MGLVLIGEGNFFLFKGGQFPLKLLIFSDRHLVAILKLPMLACQNVVGEIDLTHHFIVCALFFILTLLQLTLFSNFLHGFLSDVDVWVKF